MDFATRQKIQLPKKKNLVTSLPFKEALASAAAPYLIPNDHKSSVSTKIKCLFGQKHTLTYQVWYYVIAPVVLSY